MTIQFTLDGIHNRLSSEWRNAGPYSMRGNMQRHASLHGAAGVWLCDGRFLMYYRETGLGTLKIRRKTWKDARPVTIVAKG